MAAEEDSLYPFYLGKDSGKQNGKLNRTLHSLNPFKKNKAGGGWFNPEEFTAQKREWAKQFTGDGQAVSEHHKLFESFFIAGLPPSTDIKSVTADAQTTKTARHDHVHMRFAPETTKEKQHRGSRGKPMTPQILYSFPSDKPISSEVASFCFPHGVQPTLLERTPSMSGLNEIIYGQRFLHSDANSFIFLMKVADNMPLYGVCCYMDELVHRPPAILSSMYPEHTAPLSRYLVSAPRCYCMLTHYPFFSLHLKVLHMIMGLERLDRIMSFAEEAADCVPESPFASTVMQERTSFSSGAGMPSRNPPRQHQGNGQQRRSMPASRHSTGSAARPESLRLLQGGQLAEAAEAARTKGAVEALAVAIKRVSTSLPEDQSNGDCVGLEDLSAHRPSSFSGPQLPQLGTRPSHRRSVSAAGLPPLTPNPSGMEAATNPHRLASSISRASARMRQVLDAQAEASGFKGEHSSENIGTADYDPAAVESSSDSGTSYRTARSSIANGAASADDMLHASPARMRKSGSTGALNRSPPGASASEDRSIFRGAGPHSSASHSAAEGKLHTDLPSVEPSARSLLKSQSLRPHLFNTQDRGGAKEPAGALQVMQSYYEAAVPQPGQDFEFSADDTLQPVHYYRPPLQMEPGAPERVHRTQIANAEAEAAAGLRSWTVAQLCRCLSLDNILLLLTAVLLEQQMVLFCPNVGLLSTAVLSLVPLIRPFAWQSLLLPILPALDQMLDLLEAPVPFILGVQFKTADVTSRCSSLIRVNVYKDSIKNAERLPPLPGGAALHLMLEPAYKALKSACSEGAHSRPTYDVTEAEKRAAEDFLTTMEGYLGGLCLKMQLHTITDVQTPDRVSLLLRDSFIESFGAKDRNFVRMFVETQMFSVYCDTVMA